MSLILDVLAWAALLGGGFFTIVGAVGLHRMPDFFTRTHAASVNDTGGIGLLVLGMLLQTDDWMLVVRLLIVLVVVYTTGAVAVHALARAALHDGERPLLAGSDGRLRRTKVGSIYPDLAERLARPLVSEQVENDEPEPLPLPAQPAAAGSAPAPRHDGEGRRWNS